jgi:hypothetical protein
MVRRRRRVTRTRAPARRERASVRGVSIGQGCGTGTGSAFGAAPSSGAGETRAVFHRHLHQEPGAGDRDEPDHLGGRVAGDRCAGGASVPAARVVVDRDHDGVHRAPAPRRCVGSSRRRSSGWCRRSTGSTTSRARATRGVSRGDGAAASEPRQQRGAGGDQREAEPGAESELPRMPRRRRWTSSGRTSRTRRSTSASRATQLSLTQLNDYPGAGGAAGAFRRSRACSGSGWRGPRAWRCGSG